MIEGITKELLKKPKGRFLVRSFSLAYVTDKYNSLEDIKAGNAEVFQEMHRAVTNNDFEIIINSEFDIKYKKVAYTEFTKEKVISYKNAPSRNGFIEFVLVPEIKELIAIFNSEDIAFKSDQAANFECLNNLLKYCQSSLGDKENQNKKEIGAKPIALYCRMIELTKENQLSTYCDKNLNIDLKSSKYRNIKKYFNELVDTDLTEPTRNDKAIKLKNWENVLQLCKNEIEREQANKIIIKIEDQY